MVRWLPGSSQLVELVPEPTPVFTFADSGEMVDALDDDASGRVLLRLAGGLAWSRRV